MFLSRSRRADARFRSALDLLGELVEPRDADVRALLVRHELRVQHFDEEERDQCDAEGVWGRDDGDEVGILSFLVSAKHLWGGDVQYLKEGAITVTPDPDGIDFPNVNYDFSQSRTDVMHYNIGIHFTSK